MDTNKTVKIAVRLAYAIAEVLQKELVRKKKKNKKLTEEKKDEPETIS